MPRNLLFLLSSHLLIACAPTGADTGGNSDPNDLSSEELAEDILALHEAGWRHLAYQLYDQVEYDEQRQGQLGITLDGDHSEIQGGLSASGNWVLSEDGTSSLVEMDALWEEARLTTPAWTGTVAWTVETYYYYSSMEHHIVGTLTPSTGQGALEVDLVGTRIEEPGTDDWLLHGSLGEATIDLELHLQEPEGGDDCKSVKCG